MRLFFLFALMLLAVMAPASAQDRSCAEGGSEACALLMQRLGHGRGATADRPKALTELDAGCQKGSNSACFYAVLLRTAWESEPAGTPAVLARLSVSEQGRASQLVSSDCGAGSMQACYHLGLLQERGWLMPKDPASALSHYKEACNASVARACSHQASLLESGPPSFRDPMQAQELHRQACNGGAPESCYALAMGGLANGTRSGLDQAERRFTEGCNGGHMASCRELGRMHLDNKAASPSGAEAARLLKQACLGGDAQACELQGRAP